VKRALNTLETGWTVLPPHTNLAAKLNEFRCLQRDRVRTKPWICGSLLCALSGRMRAQASHSVVVGRLSPARVRASSNWETLQGQFPVTALYVHVKFVEGNANTHRRKSSDAHWAIHSAESERVLSGARDVTASDAFNGSALGPRRNDSTLQQEHDSGEHEGACARLQRRHDLLFEDGSRG
jgi:hypothetical protein